MRGQVSEVWEAGLVLIVLRLDCPYGISIIIICQQPYHYASCSCRMLEAKLLWARLILGWETSWEYLVAAGSSIARPVGGGLLV